MTKLILAIFGRGVQFQCLLFLLVQALIFGVPVVSLVPLMRSLCLLPGGLGRFVPCSVGANHYRLRHIGWEKCGHGLASRPRECASELFLNVLLGLFRYPPGSGRALLAGILPLRYCAARFACRTPTWPLPVPGLLFMMVLGERILSLVFVGRFAGLVVLLRGGKEFDLTEKPCTPCGFGVSISATCVEAIACCWGSL